METVKKIIGVMDPNSFSFRITLEELLAYIKPKIEYNGKIHEVVTQRIKTRPYDVLHATCPYSAIINRGAHWNPHHNSYFMTVGYDTYILNDMISFQAINKNSSYGHMHGLGFYIPPTVALPPQNYEELRKNQRLNWALFFSENEFFDLEEIGSTVGYPAYLKPQSGGGWIGVVKVENYEELLVAYHQSGEKPMNLQKAVSYREFVRTMGIGPQMLPMHYNPTNEYSHDRYLRSPYQAVEFNFLTLAEQDEVKKICKVINAFYKWDHNSCETLIGHDGICYPIDFANAYPDCSFASLHFHFPNIVKAMAKWMIFCAVTEKKKSFNFAQDWPQYFAIMQRPNLSYKEKLDLYAVEADKYFETEKFEQFCREKLESFDEQAFFYFGSEAFRHIMEKEIHYYFKLSHEIPGKLAHYSGIHDFWLHCEKDRLQRGK